jgi:putative two-component system hydrogenase maturation factor HypX/HoxX
MVSAHNGLSQRVWIALNELGHAVSVAVVDSPAAMEVSVREHDPQLIVCPFLKTKIPESIWSRHRCLIVHPGPLGDRGPSSLDWAIQLGMHEWAVTVLQANGEYDAGDVWATRNFQLRNVEKGSLYRHEVRRAAVEALVEAIGRILDGERPQEQASEVGRAVVTGRPRPLMKQEVRAIAWGSDSTEGVLRKLRAADGHPGVLDVLGDTEFYLFGGHREGIFRGRPGELIAQRTGAICRATRDGAVWITHLKRRDSPAQRFFKLPAARALALAGIELDVPEIPLQVETRLSTDETYREIAYEERGPVGFLQFDFYNGAMSADQCRRLMDAYAYARARRQTRVIVLMGGRDYFSNGIHLSMIEASEDPAAESWRNLRAINDIVQQVIETDSHIVIAALAGDAAAGGVPLALAADHVLAREDVVLNPYYQHMGGLYGSEYWTYLLPRRLGPTLAQRLVGPPFTPIGAHEAVRIGLLDAAFGADLETFRAETRALAKRLASRSDFETCLERKRQRRARDERIKPLEAYRSEELARSHNCFFGADPSYHHARQRFVYKLTAPHPGATALSPVPTAEKAA